MINILQELIPKIAKEYGITSVILISDTEMDFGDLEIIRAPREYVEIIKNTFSITLSSGLTEIVMSIPGISEFIESYLETSGNEKRAVVCVYLPNIKGAFLVDGETRLTKILKECSSYVNLEALRATLAIALSLAFKGREGRSVGTAFVIGDAENVLKKSRQAILNPFEGHPKEKRDIKNQENWETIKEFAQLDGVFVIDSDGYIVSAGRYLDIEGDVVLKYGLGGRHIACASITKSTKSVAIVVSSSGGDITIFKDGEAVFEIPVSLM